MSSTFHYGDTEAEQKKHLLLKSIAPLGSVSKFSYDNFGNPLTSQVQNADANPSYFIRGETTYTDDGNYVTEQKDARGKIVRTETDPQRGTTTSVTDAKGQTVEYKYDELRRIVKTSAKMGAKEGIPTIHNEYTYDEQRGNLVEIRHNTDGNAANDVVYSFEQDALGRQTAVKVGNQTLSQSVYQNDPTKPNFGTLTATTYGNGAKIRSRYDDFNRVTGVVYGEETAPRYEYDYNAKGQVARVRDNLLNRTTQSEYDLANRPVRVKTSEDAKHVYTGQVAYDNVYGNLSEFTEKAGENRQEFGTKFGYDDENRPTSLTYSASGKEIGQSTTTIDKLNRTTFSAVKLGSKTFTSEYHFAAGGYGTGSVTNLVASITQPGCNCGYGYDDNGNIASATLNGKWTGYTYDALGQLVQVNDHSDTRSGSNGTTWKYTYDLGGNILKKERFAYADTTTPLETVTYTYGDANWRDKLTAVNGNDIAYDAIGNPLNDGTWTYTWQNGRQLQKMQKPGVTAEFVYNADGLRVQKTVNGVATKYTLHGKNVVHMTSGTDELHFFYDAQNRPAVVVYNGMAYAYVKSLQGDIVAILDESGNAVVSYGYDAWGAPLWCTGELAETLGKVQPFRYRGYVFDEETGLYYLRSRYYNPQQLRWINSDNIIAVNSGFTAANNYVYCGNSPINRYDANGRSWKDVVRGLIHRGNECLMSLGVDTTSIGAFLLMMEEEPADSGIYHAKENCWQQYFGYNDLYDYAFDIGTDMQRVKFDFVCNGTSYVLWAWKGDYINLGAGAELGIYTGDNFQKNVNTRLAMPMRLTLSYNGAEIINYHPTAEQWWITGFNSNYMRVKACDLTATFSVRFTDQEMYDAFYGTWNNREQDGCRWVFDGTTCTATLRF